MAKTKTITVAGREVVVTELTMQQIFDLTEAKGDNAAGQLLSLLANTTTISREQLLSFAPSELGEVVAAILEVNNDFLSQARALGMTEMAASMEGLVRSLFTIAFLP